ncbi:hypothetical protein [Croceitalea sp. P059]|uniref:hypothetical protein n=1 Tax=Croceitalea sp. P059 TaxID=3075601 RepID=UPI0028866681|nr:hypothetical protein [Croceitalea sp. P059]MDT0539075.1 hypothetical protein [Croceitalea sp. P059]
MSSTKYLVLAFFILSFLSYSQEYFEGKIHYTIEYETINKNIPDGYLETQMGDSFNAFVKEDKYIMVHNGTGELGAMKTIIRLDEGFSYVIYENSDTIYKSPLNLEKNKLLILKKVTNEKKEVLGEMCDYVSIDYENNDPNSFFKVVRGKHFFNPKYKLNPEKYKNHTSGFWNQFVDLSQSICIRNEHEYEGLFKSVSYATEIKQENIPEAMFLMDSTKIIKQVD